MDDSIRWLAALQSDLGCRIAEVAGLALSDLVLDEAIPYVSIKVHPWRSLKKGKENERNIPLVGLSLWAAQRIKSTAANGQTMAFPRYCSIDGCKATSASGAVNKWLRSKPLGLAQKNHTSHDFRHAMADRLREVQCPEDIRKKIGGWKVYGLSEVYGKGYSLKVMLVWLQKVVLHCVQQPQSGHKV
jgi:integrase